jgi:hypothetical protein
MNVQSSGRCAFSVGVVMFFLAACGANLQVPPQQLSAPQRVANNAADGIYVSVSLDNTYSYVEAFPDSNNGNGGPICNLPGLRFIWDLNTDLKGNLIVPDSLYGIYVYRGPGLCGELAGKIAGLKARQAVDVAANDAIHGPIAVGYYTDLNGGPGSIAVCTIASGCTENLTSRYIKTLWSDTMAHNGDCWGDGINKNQNLKANLVYYAGCKMPGRLATGFKNPFAGGLEIDNMGHVLAVSDAAVFGLSGATLYVYSGCNPKCTLFGGPFVLGPPGKDGAGVFAHLDRSNQRLAVASNTTDKVEVFSYIDYGKKLKYLYSFDNGLNRDAAPIGVAYSAGSRR